MRILFLHPNFPGQFRHLAAALAQDPNHRVVFATTCKTGNIPGVQKVLYQEPRSVSSQTHRYVRDLESAVLQGQKQQFPVEYQNKLKVLHDGVDTTYFRPNPRAKLGLPEIGLDLSLCIHAYQCS